MFTFQCRRSPAKKRGFALPPLSVFQRSGLTETVCGRPQGSLAALRRCAAQNPDGFCLENDAFLYTLIQLFGGTLYFKSGVKNGYS